MLSLKILSGMHEIAHFLCCWKGKFFNIFVLKLFPFILFFPLQLNRFAVKQKMKFEVRLQKWILQILELNCSSRVTFRCLKILVVDLL